MTGGNESLDEKLKDVKIPYHIIDYSDNRFTEDERKYLGRQLRSMFAFVGCAVPDRVVADGVEFPLQEIIWRLLSKEKLSETDLAVARELVPVLERKLKDNRGIIETYSLTDEEAEKVYFEACGLLKAIVTLRSLDSNKQNIGLAQKVQEEKVSDARRLLELLRRI